MGLEYVDSVEGGCEDLLEVGGTSMGVEWAAIGTFC